MEHRNHTRFVDDELSTLQHGLPRLDGSRVDPLGIFDGGVDAFDLDVGEFAPGCGSRADRVAIRARSAWAKQLG